MREPTLTLVNNHLPLGPGEVLELSSRAERLNLRDVFIGGAFLLLGVIGIGSAILAAAALALGV